MPSGLDLGHGGGQSRGGPSACCRPVRAASTAGRVCCGPTADLAGGEEEEADVEGYVLVQKGKKCRQSFCHSLYI